MSGRRTIAAFLAGAAVATAGTAQASDVSTLAAIAVWAPKVAEQGNRIASCARRLNVPCLRREADRMIDLGFRANDAVTAEMRSARRDCVVDAGLMFRQSTIDWVHAGLAIRKRRYAEATAAMRAAGRHADQGTRIIQGCTIR